VPGHRHRARLPAALALAGLAVFALAPQWWFPSGHNAEFRWPAWQQAVGSGYCGFAVLVPALSACGTLTPHGTPGTGLSRHLSRFVPFPRAGKATGSPPA
jgi:hypothetical protein